MLLQTAQALILYNTLMGLAAATALLLLVPFARYGATAPLPVRRSWAWTFGMLGAILFTMGLHLNFAWPLLGAANIIFGEPALAFGAVLIVGAVIIGYTPVEESAGTLYDDGPTPLSEFPEELAVTLRPISYFGALSGLMVILLGAGGAALGEIVFRPPSAEFPTGIVAGTGLEIVYMVVTYTVLGLGAIALPFGLHNRRLLKPAGALLVLAGLLVLFITLISFVGHVSLSAGAPPGGIPW